MSYQHTRNRVKDRPRNAQRENIDKQICCLHKAMAEKLLANHHYIPQVHTCFGQACLNMSSSLASS
jgi:hypothetical protein